MTVPAKQMSDSDAKALLGMRVLVVDDHPDERQLLALCLRQHGAQVQLGVNGLEAVEMATQWQPDAVLMDVNLPGLDGVSACQRLREDVRSRRIPILLISGACQPPERVRGLMAGAVDYVSKPYDLNEVVLRLRLHRPLAPPKPAGVALVPPAAANDAQGAQARRAAGVLDQALYEAARSALRVHGEAGPDVSDVAARVGTSPRRLNEAFQRCCGRTVLEFWREERLVEGQRLLRDTLLDVGAIALELGFSNGANFATAFRERYGCTPSRFRQEQLSQGSSAEPGASGALTDDGA